MNNTLQLKGTFTQAPNNSKGGGAKLPAKTSVNLEKLNKLLNDLNRLYNYWVENTILPGALISVYYNKVAAKSNRIKGLLDSTSIVGARFYDETIEPKHIITHFVRLEAILAAINNIIESISIMEKYFDGEVSSVDFDNKILNNPKNIDKIFHKIKNQTITKTLFKQIIVDAYYVDKFDILIDTSNLKDNSIITIFDTNTSTIDLMNKIGINIDNSRIMDKTTLFLFPSEIELLKANAGYLISMAVSDLSELVQTDFNFENKNPLSISRPQNEPTIGVIDTLFDEHVYFSEWVKMTNFIHKDIPIADCDYQHGTAVTSIIVDGPSLNPDLDDGCGRFKVRHFAVTTNNKFSSFGILKKIETIVKTNLDIKVWNLSLGSKLEINPHFISPEAAILDKIQIENDVIFIIAGTNKDAEDKLPKSIGAPADSINSIVVNSVTRNNTPTSYTRIGPVLSFFTKPDIAYYGGDTNSKIRVCTNRGIEFVQGTSFAAPWIARKISYLIDVLGFNREEAKALLIHSATKWDKQTINPIFVGHGVVPKNIEQIVNSPENEIQFIISGISQDYNTYNYNIPVPVHNEHYPFIAKATLCYFPSCSRNQGVDYTNTELDIHFGRIDKNEIKPINNNYQDVKGHYTPEEDARKNFRKWDNVKHLREVFTERVKPRKAYETGLWGVSLKTKERLTQKYGLNLKFSIVITLRELEGINRINEFINLCQIRGWLVQSIDIKNRINIHQISEQEIRFED